MTGCTRWMPIGFATVLHFLVDGLCVCCLYLMAKADLSTDVLSLFLLYNVLAFMSQPLTGFWTDRLCRPQKSLLLSACLLLAAVAVLVAAMQGRQFMPLCALSVSALLGMGNSLFHVWGGKMTAAVTGNDMRALGIYVSSGVMGLTVGALYASWWLMAGMLLGIAILAAQSVFSPLPLWVSASKAKSLATWTLPQRGSRRGLWILPSILAFVMMRSFVGEAIAAEVEKPSSVLLLLAVTAMMGKALGGWLARCIGICHAILLCVGVAAACLMCGEGAASPLLPVLTGIFAINLTMPMTLYASNRLLPGREALSFGLLAAALIPGYMLFHSFTLLPVHLLMLSALLPTVAVEVGMLMLMREKRKDVLTGAILVNILTNVPLNCFLLMCGYTTSHLVAGETVVLLVEALWYYLFIRDLRRAAIYSFLCNTTSFLVGILIEYLSYNLLTY